MNSLRNSQSVTARPGKAPLPWRSTLSKLLLYLAVLAWLAFALGPYLWMLLTSIKPAAELNVFPVQYLPSEATLSAFKLLFTTTSFGQYFFNSSLVALGTVLVTTTVAVLAAYALSRFDVPGKRYILIGLLVTQLVPAVLLVVPLFLSLRSVGLLNSPWGIMIVHSAFALPFTIWLMTGFLDALPRELDEAALIDGCSHFEAFRWIITPLLAPGLAASATYVFVYSWNEFLYALTFTSTDSARTLPVGLHNFIGEYTIRWDLLSAGGVISVIPTVIFFMLVQRHLIAGLASGAVKG